MKYKLIEKANPLKREELKESEGNTIDKRIWLNKGFKSLTEK